MGEVEYKLYAKASPDGKSLGDCPFTQRANLALKLKRLPATLVLIDLSNKPKWFLNVNPPGTAPALEFGGTVIGDSYEIVRHLERAHPSPSLDLPGNSEAEEVSKDVFNMFSAWVKNKEADKAAELERKFTQELEKIDKFLSRSPGPLLCGENWSIADCVLAPRLYHISIVVGHFKQYSYFDGLTHLSTYMEAAFSSDVFRATDYPEAFVIKGWSGKNTEEYKRILTNLEAIVSTLEGLPSASQTLRRKMCEKSWISPTANPLKDNLMSAVLGRVQMEAAQFHEFVALLRDIAGLGPLVCRLTGGSSVD